MLHQRAFLLWILATLLVAAMGCTAAGPTPAAAPLDETEMSEDAGSHSEEVGEGHSDSEGEEHGEEHGEVDHGATLIEELQPAALEGRKPRIVATTNLVGDVVQRVAGDRVELTILIPAGSDPHAFTATPRDLVALEDADMIFISGFGLEESLLSTLGGLAAATVVSVNQGVTPLAGDDHDHAEGEAHAEDKGHAEDEVHDHEGGIDPHTWQSVSNVMVWSENVAAALAAIDPAGAEAYNAASSTYQDELQALDSEIRVLLEKVPADRRKLVTDHDTFAYFADAYDFIIVGSVIPSFSSLATISAQELAQLQEQMSEEGAVAIFTGNTVSTALSEQVAQDMGVPVVPLYTDSLGPVGSGAENYIEMMRLNARQIAEALR